MKPTPLLCTLAGALVLSLLPDPAAASATSVCMSNTGSPGERCGPFISYKSLDRRHRFKAAPAPAADGATHKALGGETLQGSLAGDWEQVFGVIAYPVDPTDENLYTVGLSLPAQATGGNRYDVPGWTREGFFVDAGDGILRLLAASLVDEAFVPESGDALTTAGQLWVSEFTLFREIEELERDPDFYENYENFGADSDVRFVTDADGRVLDVAFDIHDQFGNYQYSVTPQAGDEYMLGQTVYDLREPDFVFIRFQDNEYFTIVDGIDIVKDYVVPSDQTDPVLPEGFDSADLELFLIVEGARSTGDGDDEAEFAYSTPESLGYTWGEAKSGPGGSGGGSSGALGPWLLLLMLGAGLRRRGSASALIAPRS